MIKDVVAPLDATLSIIERKFALYIILAVKNHPGCTKTQIVNLDPQNLRTKHQRINELIEAGIITTDGETRMHNSMPLYLTNVGQTIAARIDEIRMMLPQVECNPEDY